MEITGMWRPVMALKIETERLIIRRFLPDDYDDLYDYLSDESVVKFEPYNVYSRGECKREAERRSKLDSFLAVCLKDGGKLIGNIYFKQQEPRDLLTWELGFVFNAAYHGKGYATESCMAILHNAFGNNARRVVATCDPKNRASWKLLERLGFRREGHLVRNIYFRKDAAGNPVWKDTYEYAILSDEFLPGRVLKTGLK
jgi:ribosomal-protein-alanine N-acetyltransferase